MEATDRADEAWQQMLDRALTGDLNAFGRLWQEYLRPQKIYPLVLEYIKNSHDAEDLTQDVFVHLFERGYYQRIRRRDLAGFEGCVRRMAYNAVIDHFRATRQVVFVMTPEVIVELRSAGVAEPLLVRLTALTAAQPVNRTTFTQFLADALGDALTDALKIALLRLCRCAQPYCATASPDTLLDYADEMTMQAELEQRELAAIVHEVRGQLRPEEWDVFAAKHTAPDFTYRSYAKRTGIPVTTLHSRYQRVRDVILTHHKLRAYWEHSSPPRSKA